MPEESDVYEKMGDFYDLIYSEGFDSDFYLKEAKKCKGKVLELGCGTGRIAIKLAKEGIDVTGLDVSGNMLELLKKNAEEEGVKVKTHLGDMRNFKINDKFGLAIFPYRSFLHLLTEDDREKTLKNIYKHLQKGGKATIHIYNPSEDELKRTGGLHQTDTNTVVLKGKKFTLKWFLRYYPENGMADYVIVALDEEGKERNRFEMTIYFVRPVELRELLKKCGFRKIKTYCGFEYEEFDEFCQEIMVVAEK